MAETVEKVVIDMDALTLGDWQTLKRKGLNLVEFDPSDPDHIVTVLALVFRREDPSLTDKAALEKAQDVKIVQVLNVDEDEPKADPTQDGASQERAAEQNKPKGGRAKAKASA